MLKQILTLAISAALTTTAVAQTANIYIPDNDATSGGCNVIPFGTQKTSTTWVNQRYQTMALASDLGNAQALEICDIQFAQCTASQIASFDTIEIKMGQTKATSLGTNFDANMVANVQTVLKATNYKWHLTMNTWNAIGLDKSYNYIAALGPNIVLEVLVTGNDQPRTTGFHTGARERLYAFTWTGTPPASGTVGSTAALKWGLVIQNSDLSTFGEGCKGSNGIPALGFTGSASLGSSFSIDVSNCVANAPSLQVLGLARFEPAIDLGILGAPGCRLYETIDALIGAVADSSGNYSLKFTVPKDRNLLCVRIYTQAFPTDSNANKWGRTASNYGRILPGY